MNYFLSINNVIITCDQYFKQYCVGAQFSLKKPFLSLKTNVDVKKKDTFARIRDLDVKDRQASIGGYIELLEVCQRRKKHSYSLYESNEI